MAKKRSRTRKVSKKSIALIKKKQLSKKRLKKRTSRKTQEGGNLGLGIGITAFAAVALYAYLWNREKSKSRETGQESIYSEPQPANFNP